VGPGAAAAGEPKREKETKELNDQDGHCLARRREACNKINITRYIFSFLTNLLKDTNIADIFLQIQLNL
jgi:hypothetical protein